MRTLLRKEPALFSAAVTALLALLFAYGLVTQEQVAAWGGFAMAALAIAQGVFTRSQVYSENTIREAGLTPKILEERQENPNIQRRDDNEGAAPPFPMGD